MILIVKKQPPPNPPVLMDNIIKMITNQKIEQMKNTTPFFLYCISSFGGTSF